eukprot:RCo040538
MGSITSKSAVRRTTVLRADTQIVVEHYAEGTYLENYGFLKTDRFEFSVCLSPSPTWAEEQAEKMMLCYPNAEEPVDIRKYIAHKIALLNWLNGHPRLGGRFCISLEDRDVATEVVKVRRGNDKVVEKEVELQVVIKGDADYIKTKVLTPTVVGPCRNLIALATPDWKHNDTNAVRLLDGHRKKFSAIMDLNSGDSPPVEMYTHDMLQDQVDQFYTKWTASRAYGALQQSVQEWLLKSPSQQISADHADAEVRAEIAAQE